MNTVRVALALLVAGMTLVAMSHGDLLGTILLGAGAYLLWPKDTNNKRGSKQ